MAFGAQGPIDYSSLLQQAQPAQQFNAGLQAGNNVVQMGIQQQQQQLQLNMQKQMALDFHNLAANPTTQNIAAMAAKYPQMAGNFKSAYDMLTTQQQKAQQDQLYPVYAALNSGNPQLAAQNLRLAATAAQNSGDTAGAARYNQWATLATTAPSYVKSMVGFGLASTGGPQQFTQNMSTMGANERAQELQPSAVKTATANATVAGVTAANAPQAAQLSLAKTANDMAVENAKLGIERNKTQSDFTLGMQKLTMQYGANGELSPEVHKIVDAPALAAADAQTKANQFDDMANQFQNFNASTGAFGEAAEKWKQLWGSKDQISVIKDNYARIRAQGLAANLPPQVKRLTDSDLRVFGAGIPEVNAPPSEVVPFLRAMATMKTIESLNNNATANWGAANRSMGPARMDMTIGGINVPKGTNYSDFAKNYVGAGVTAYKQSQVNNSIASRSYMPYAQGGNAQGGNPQMQQPQQQQAGAVGP